MVEAARRPRFRRMVMGVEVLWKGIEKWGQIRMEIVRVLKIMKISQSKIWLMKMDKIKR